MNLDVRDLELVREVARSGSLTAASKTLCVTQSALSHRLSDLEGRIGAPLFRRESRSMVPTAAGERLARTADRVLGEIKAAWDDVNTYSSTGVGTLRLSIACYTGYSWLSEILDRFQTLHPGIVVEIDPGSTRDAVDAVRSGAIDLALSPGPVVDDNLASEPLFRDEFVVLMSPRHPLAIHDVIESHHFRDHHVIAYSADPKQSYFLGAILGPEGVTPRRTTGVPLTEAILELVKANQGVAFLARWAATPQLADGTLVDRPLGNDGTYRHWHAITMRRDAPLPHLAAFVGLLKAHLPQRFGRATVC